MNDKYAQIVRVCEEMVKNAADPQIADQIQHTKQLVEHDHIPTVALVGMGPVGSSLLDAASAIVESEVPDILNRAFAQGPVCLTLTHGDEEVLYRVGNEGAVRIAQAGIGPAEGYGVKELECAFPCDGLKNKRMILCGDMEGHDAWMHLFENMDAIIFRINATAAMSQAERNWIDNELIPLFGHKQVAIWIDLLEQLNTEADQADVMEHVKRVLHKRNMNVPVFAAAKEAGRWATAELDNMDADRHIRKALRIGLKAVSERIEEVKQVGTIDEKTAAKALSQLEAHRSRLELAGEIAADTTVANFYVQLKADAKAGVRDFNRQAVSGICSKIENAAPEELETLEPKIQAYLGKVWERYRQELQVKMNEEIRNCYGLLMERMEKDAGAMVAALDEDTQRIIQAALSRQNIGPYAARFCPDWEYQGSNSLTKLKTETRNLMLLSIPLVFFNPLLSAAMVIGVRCYQKTETKKRVEELRASMQTQVRVGCEVVVEDICAQIERSLDDAAGQMVSAVREAYKGLTDTLIQQLRELCEQQRELMTRIEKLQQMQTVTIPDLMCRL